ncbi:MAG: DUF2752 domain-containing protein, partial [Lachnospiraceae bacterium]|nr:DUF2752 domain-containing protein [Lachnospiraceae bacterium]
MKKEPEQDNFFYMMGWACMGIILIYLFFKIVLKIDLIRFMPLCTFYKTTGFYCPGCGGTRAVFALFRGDILKSLFYHPVVPYGAIVGVWFMITQTMERLSRGKWKVAMHFRMIYVYILL